MSLPDDFAPTDKHLSYAAKFGHDRRWVMREIERCRAWHMSKGMERTNWNQVVRNWLMKAVEIQQERSAVEAPKFSELPRPAKWSWALNGIVKYAKTNPSYAKHLLNLQEISAQRAILGAVPEDVRGILER